MPSAAKQRYSAIQVAECILRAAHAQGHQIDHLKLQKLLYYAQAWHLALNDVPLFESPIQAWVHGPVTPEVFHQFKSCGWNAIPAPAGECAAAELQTFIHEVYRAYGHLSGFQLVRLTHSEAPWKHARGALQPHEPCNEVISPEAMAKFYRAKAKHAKG